jgi:hypothetical protein
MLKRTETGEFKKIETRETAAVITSWNGPDTIVRGPIAFVVIARRGQTRIGYNPREVLPYIVAQGENVIARCADRVSAAWIMDGIEGVRVND